MSFASHNPEIIEGLAIRALPEPWRERVEEGKIDLYDVPKDVFDEAMDHACGSALRDYFADLAGATEDERGTEEK